MVPLRDSFFSMQRVKAGGERFGLLSKNLVMMCPRKVQSASHSFYAVDAL